MNKTESDPVIFYDILELLLLFFPNKMNSNEQRTDEVARTALLGWVDGWMKGWRRDGGMDGVSSPPTPAPRPADQTTTGRPSGRPLYLLVVGGPDAAGDLALQVDLGGPVALAADGAHQHEAVPVGDQRLGAVVGPREVTHLGTRTRTRTTHGRIRNGFLAFVFCKRGERKVLLLVLGPALRGRSPTPPTSVLRIGSRRRCRPPCRRWPASGRARSSAPAPPGGGHGRYTC